jgi:hypothetical protein
MGISGVSAMSAEVRISGAELLFDGSVRRRAF